MLLFGLLMLAPVAAADECSCWQGTMTPVTVTRTTTPLCSPDEAVDRELHTPLALDQYCASRTQTFTTITATFTSTVTQTDTSISRTSTLLTTTQTTTTPHTTTVTTGSTITTTVTATTTSVTTASATETTRTTTVTTRTTTVMAGTTTRITSTRTTVSTTLTTTTLTTTSTVTSVTMSATSTSTSVTTTTTTLGPPQPTTTIVATTAAPTQPTTPAPATTVTTTCTCTSTTATTDSDTTTTRAETGSTNTGTTYTWTTQTVTTIPLKVCELLSFYDRNSYVNEVTGKLSFGGAQFDDFFNESLASGYRVGVADKCKRPIAGWSQDVEKTSEEKSCCDASDYVVDLVNSLLPEDAFYFVVMVRESRFDTYTSTGVTVPINDNKASGNRLPALTRTNSANPLSVEFVTLVAAVAALLMGSGL